MNRKARILFVDDEKRVLNSMRALFRREHELFLAIGGAEALQLAKENDIDVIVTDQRMPGMTGVEVLANMKRNSPRTVRILLTGYADPNAIEASINEGEVFRFLSKPCPPALLRETLGLAVEASGTEPIAEQVPSISDNDDTQPALPIINESKPPPKISRPPFPVVGVVVFTIDSEFAATVIRAVSTERDTTIATTLIKVADTIARKRAGVLITDFTTNKDILQKIIGALKQRLPELITITVSDGRDSEDMINLINYGQVFRYVVNPVEPDRIRNDINAAVTRHSHLLHNPADTIT
jgi:DNA-binding NtrC family response regulator